MPDSKVINNPFLEEQNTTKVSQPNGSTFDPSTAKPVANAAPASNNKNSKFDPSTAKAVDKGFGGHVRDLGASLMGGLASVPDVAVGVADLYSGGRAGKAVDNLSENFKLGDGRKYWQDQKTDHAKVQSQEFADAEGIVDKTKVALSNPSMITNTVVESLPSMALGGLAGRGLNVASKGLINPVAAGAAGEGLVMAGAQAEQIRQETDDGLLTGKQVAAAAGTGVAGSLLGFLGGTVAKKLGFEDVDTLMARGVKPEQVAGEISQIPFSSIPKSIVLGAISEGLLEEMPQSVTEQVLQNYALDKDLFEGVDDAIVMGTLAGMAMGGTVAGASQASKWAGQPNTDNPVSGDETDTTGSTPMLPAPTGGNGGSGLGFDGLQGEYIPAGQQDAVDPVQARQNFEYDQMATEAERQIEFGGLSRQYAPTPSEQMGLDPNLGPLSAAAATAVDNGVSQQMQIEMQAQTAAETASNVAGKTEDSNAPLQQAADAARELTPEQIHGKQNTYGVDVTTAIEQLKQRQQGEQNAPITIDEGIQNGTAQQGNAPFNNGSQSVSEQHDTNAASAMGAATGAAQKGLQPAKADAGQIVPSNQSLNEIQTSEAKSKLPDIQSKVTELEAQLVAEKSVPKKAQIRKQIAKLQQDNPIDQGAHAAATSIQNDLPEPTQAQIEAGNYKKGHIKVHGLDIAVENPRGSERRGTDPDGKEWAHTMSDHYGYLKRTVGADNENIDTYIGRNPESEQVFIVDQIDQKTGGFDEHKVMMGFNSQEDAIQAYSSNFDKGWKVGPVRAMNKDEFKSWLKDGDTKKPAGGTLTNEGTKEAPRTTETALDEKQVKASYGDSLESVMSDVETLGDDFTIDLHSVPKKRNALKNPNYHAVQHENGHVEILGMKHPATGEWVGKAPVQNKAPAQAPVQEQTTEVEQPQNLDEQIAALDAQINAEPRPKLLERARLRKERDALVEQRDGKKPEPAPKPQLTREQREQRAAEKEMQGIIEAYDRLYKDQPISAIEKSLERLNKDIQKQHESSLGEVSNGKRSTRKAVAAGARDRFLKDRHDLEKYLKYRKSTEKLYSRVDGQNNQGSTPEQVREALVERFGEKTISSLERRGLLDIVSTVDEPGVEGFYQNGRVTLVASNLNEISIIPTFLHELGGHGGFQNTMSQEKYADLMGIFNDMVQRKHPLALEAKRLAERETDAKTQQLEYLPYLLTLASTQQEMNALQKSAIKRFIDKVVSAVKAWAFDRLGINLNLNENDMVALANRMIQQQIAEPTSVENVRAQLQGTDQWMKAPNGKPTNLTEQQWLQVRTPEFKQWFGDWENSPETASKVVDENGEPQVVYHGTSSQFTRFKLGGGLLGRGVYLTDRFEEAQNYAGSRSQDNEGTVMPLFANIPEMFNSNSKTTREQVVGAMQDGFNGIRHQFNNMDYLVAFNPEQVKSAVGNTGLFSSQDTDIRFSRQANAQQIIQNLVSNMNKQGRNKLKTEAGYKAIHALQYVLGTLGRRQLTELYQKLLPQLKPYNDMVAMMDADQNEVAAMSDELARRWADLKDEKELANVMHDATLAKIDPAKPYQPGDNVAEYAKLKKQFNALSDDAKKVYREARDAYKKHHRDVRQAIQDRILRSSMSNQKKTELLQQMDANFFGYTQGVYFPLQRFGKYVVVAKNNKGEVLSVSRAETLSEAYKLREVLLTEYPGSNVLEPKLDKEFNAARDGVGRGFMTTLFNELGSLGLNAKRQTELEDILGQLYLKSLPDLSYAKHSIHRKGTAGFSQDARRAFAQNMFHGGSYLAKLRYKDQLEEMLDGMQKHANDEFNAGKGYDQRVAQQVIDEMNKRHKNMMQANSHPLSTALTSLGFLYYLGLSPASAAVNTLQTVLVAYPQMGAKWGYDKAGAALAKASDDFRKGVSIKGINPKNWENDIAKILKGDELKAYEEAVRRGVIDVTMAHDLAGIAQGEDSGVMWKLRPIMRVASTLFHNAERFNREVTFIAAYRLARDSGSMHDQAFEQAMDSTYKGHFDYSSGNRPRIMQGNIAKVILLFKQFGQNMIYTLARTAHQSLKGETPEARREAQRALAGIIGMHTVFAGVMGLPLVGPILAMASMLGSDDDEPWDAEAALRNALADALGTKTSEVLMKGASRFGPADLSGRVGINNLLLPDVQDGLEGKDFSDAMVMSGLGPVVGILTNTFKGLAEIGQGHGMRGVETMSPVFLRSPLRSIRYATEGAQDKTGVMIKDDVGMLSLASQAIGFSPSEVRLATEGRSAIYSHTKRLDKRRTELMTDYVRAVQRDDADEQKEIWAEIQAFNQKNPSRRISRVQAMQSLRQREKRVKQAEHGIYLPNKKREDADIGRFAFDE
ncbi:MAG: PLxRFG domain-containing protein [Candidatus Acinetobacter avistercoris]|nr:PLxRFG domain-containing protein [Candidatus Acinetobacter avistercoris]